MTQKELGYVELEWTCKHCNTINPGMKKVCINCGAPMSQEDKFQLPDQQELIGDQAKLEEAKKGPAIECPYCHVLNPAGTTHCIQCGGDIQAGLRRQAGEVLGAHTTQVVADKPCPYCNKLVSADAQRCPYCGGSLVTVEKTMTPAALQAKKTPLWMILAAAALAVLCIGSIITFAVMSNRTNDVTARVADKRWQLSIDVLSQQPVKKDSWRDALPAQAQDVSCQDRYRETSSIPVPNATEVCGTPYVVDQGSGAGKVVQDCEYQVYDSYCSYTILDWVVVNSVTTQGNANHPAWPAVNLQAGQQEGDRHEMYQVTFEADGETYTYSPVDNVEFNQYELGSQWVLAVNTFGEIRELRSK